MDDLIQRRFDVTALPEEHRLKLVRRARDTFNKNIEIQNFIVEFMIVNDMIKADMPEENEYE